jgi:hypothetical protein
LIDAGGIGNLKDGSMIVVLETLAGFSL